MSEPLHPMIVHLPLALTFILPFIIVIFAYMIRGNKMSPNGWLIVIGLQIVVTATGYISLETGETDEVRVEKVVSKSLIHAHEEAAEMFVASTVVALLVSIAVFFLRKELQFSVKICISFIGLLSCYLAYQTGKLGGDLVYTYGAASDYSTLHPSAHEGLLPTPGLNTSESHAPVDENESIKTDENDYGTSDENSDLEDESSKIED